MGFIVDAAAIEDAKAKAGGKALYLLAADDVECICRAPSAAEFKAFRTMAMDEAQKPVASTVLFFTCLVHPAQKDLEAAVADRPFLLPKLEMELSKASGAVAETRSKKL